MLLGIQCAFAAGAFVAASNYCMRRSMDAGGGTNAYLVVQFFFMCLVAILLNPVRTGEYGWNPSMGALGIVGGFVLTLLMIAIGKSLEKGPAGLSFAILSSSTVMPMIVMVLLFGSKFGYDYTFSKGLGSLCVVLGLFWAGWETFRAKEAWKWASFALGAFFLHILFLVFMQWRALLLNHPRSQELFLSFPLQEGESQWFMPMIFFTAALLQTGYYRMTRRLPLQRSEVLFGLLGGITNGTGTFFLIRATELSTPIEHALIFPAFSVVLLILCNLWGQILYKERINWKANALCVIGLAVGTIDWQQL